MILNLFGVLFAIAAIVLYSIDLAITSLWWLCNDDYHDYYDTTWSPAENVIMEKCYKGKELILVSVIMNIQLPSTEPYKMS